MNKTKEQEGITLIALVITIVVLLILAGVSIAMITGENGILKKANEIVDLTQYKTAEEKVNLAVIGAMADDGEMTVEELKTEVGYQGGTVSGTTFPVQVQMDGYTFTVEETGKVTSNGDSGDEEPPVEKDTLGTITGNETTNTKVHDKLGNPVVVPAGFEVVNPTDIVSDGIIIKDKTYQNTVGSEFVWIPVGKINKVDGNIETVNLSRYTFDENGGETDCKDKSIIQEDGTFQEVKTSDKGNDTAINIDEFITSAKKNQGYYVGRYEAKDKVATEERTEKSNSTNQVICTEEKYIYNWVNQPQAVKLSQNMYKSENFVSDLMNSYAFDTMISFVQKFDSRESYEKPYSRQNSLNTSLEAQGTSRLDNIQQDKICNIYDVSSNAVEWTTETGNSEENSCVTRGGDYNYEATYTALRGGHDNVRGYVNCTFRPILYL